MRGVLTHPSFTHISKSNPARHMRFNNSPSSAAHTGTLEAGRTNSEPPSLSTPRAVRAFRLNLRKPRATNDHHLTLPSIKGGDGPFSLHTGERVQHNLPERAKRMCRNPPGDLNASSASYERIDPKAKPEPHQRVAAHFRSLYIYIYIYIYTHRYK